MLGLYLHIPFCQAICSYCNFNRGLLDADLKRRYVDAIEREIRAAPAAPADTIFFGGGTPSLLEPAEVARLIAVCRDRFGVTRDAEITLETNPETASDARLAAFREAGVTRLSFGVQSFDDAQLARLGRIHSSARARDAVRAAQRAGFDDISLDLMFWLPGQSLASWLDTVQQAIELGTDHLSLYLLELYPNAPLKEAIARGAKNDAPGGWQQAADDDAADMYLHALDRLETNGLAQYEISNVARPGHASRHNLKYWQGGNWRGFGCGAHSTVDGRRWKNVASTADYIDRVSAAQPIEVDVQALAERQRLEERLFTGMRLSSGIDCQELRTLFGVDAWAEYGARLAPFVQGGWVWTRPDGFGLTRAGMLLANEILTVFV